MQIISEGGIKVNELKNGKDTSEVILPSKFY
jgi:hypothetical protein